MSARRPAVLCSALLLAHSASAQEDPGVVGVSAAPELFSASYLFQVLGSLLLVFVCLFAVIALLKRFNRIGGAQGGALRVLGSASVGQREKVVLLDAGGEQLLIGVAPGSVRTLHVFPEPIAELGEAGAPGVEFASVLRAANPLGSRS